MHSSLSLLLHHHTVNFLLSDYTDQFIVTKWLIKFRRSDHIYKLWKQTKIKLPKFFKMFCPLFSLTTKSSRVTQHHIVQHWVHSVEYTTHNHCKIMFNFWFVFIFSPVCLEDLCGCVFKCSFENT